MNKKQPSLGKREGFKQGIVEWVAQRGQPCLKIESVFARQHGHAKEFGWRMRPNSNLDASPPGELRHQVAANQAVKFEKKLIVELGAPVFAVLDTLFERLDVVREMRS